MMTGGSFARPKNSFQLPPEQGTPTPAAAPYGAVPKSSSGATYGGSSAASSSASPAGLQGSLQRPTGGAAASGSSAVGPLPLASQAGTLTSGAAASAGGTGAGAGSATPTTVLTRHSVQSDNPAGGPRPVNTLFMGTGVEGRRQEGTTSPAGGGRAGVQTGQRLSISSTPSQTSAAASQQSSVPLQMSVPAPIGASGARGSVSNGMQAGELLSANGLEIGEVQMGSPPFCPMNPALNSQLIQALGVSSHAVIEEMQGFRGGLNEGVWYLTDPAPPQQTHGLGAKNALGQSSGSGDLVLKLVRCHRIAPSVLTEAENFCKIVRDHPGVVNDPLISFPCKILGCVGPNGTKLHDLIVMRKMRGERLAEMVATKLFNNQVPQLLQIFDKLGGVVCDFHRRYGMCQHGDLQPSNIFYDEDLDRIALIDLGGMGVPTMESDMEHFAKSLKLLSEAYGAKLANDGLRYFEQGYARSERSGGALRGPSQAGLRPGLR